MDIFGSLNVFREMLNAIQDQRSGRLDKLSNFLADSNYFASVFSAILILDEKLAPPVKKDLTVFMGKAKVFIMENPEFADWWPVDREGVIRQAFRNILSGHGNQFVHFTIIMAIVRESLRMILNYECHELQQLGIRR